MSVQKNNGPIVDPALCRCCRAIKKCRILTAEYTWMGKKEIYADMVMDCYGILLSHVDDNERDSGVCATCVVRLREASAFRHQVLQCEELFLQAKLDHHDDEDKDENKLKKLDLELKTEPKDYNSDHNSLDDRDDACPVYSDDDADDNKPLKKEDPKPEAPLPKDEDLKSEDSVDFNGDSSSDSDEPIKKKMKRKAKAKTNGAKKKPAKTAKKQKAETDNTETKSSETESQKLIEIHIDPAPNPTEFKVPTEISRTCSEMKEPEFGVIIKVEPDLDNNETTISESLESKETGTDTEETTVPVKKKRLWVRPLTCEKTEYQLLCEEMESNEDLYFQHYNMSKESFEELLQLLEPTIEKEYTNYRKPLMARLRLAVCLRYFKTGLSFGEISKFYGIGRTSVSNIVFEVSRAIWDVLQPLYMPIPTKETWTRCGEAFEEIWKIPNCIGSVGGRHIIAKCTPRNPGFEYPVLKCHSTAVLVAVADPFYNLTLIDVGNYGKQSDRDIFSRTSFYKDFLQSTHLLPPKPLPGTEKPVPHVFIGNEGLPSKSFMLREFPKLKAVKDSKEKSFNDRVGPARTIDGVFDMLIKNWRVFLRPIECNVETGINIIKAACCLHNYIRNKHGTLEVDEVLVTHGKKRKRKALKALAPFRPMNGRATAAAMVVRDRFATYFNQCRESTPMDLLAVQGVSGIKVEPS